MKRYIFYFDKIVRYFPYRSKTIKKVILANNFSEAYELAKNESLPISMCWLDWRKS